MLRKALIVLVIAVIGFAGYLVWFLVSAPASEYIVVEKEEAVETLLVTGRIAGEGAVPLAFERPGQVVEVSVSEGDKVGKGDLLAMLDDRHAQVRVDQSETSLRGAQAAGSRLTGSELEQARERLNQAAARTDIVTSVYLDAVKQILEPALEQVDEAKQEEDKARKAYEEKKDLYEQGSITSSELDIYRQAWDSARDLLSQVQSEAEFARNEVANLERERDIALSQEESARIAFYALQTDDLRQAAINIEQARIQVEQAELEMEQVSLVAPARGTVTRVVVNPGQFLAAGQEVLTFLPAAARTYVEAQVDEEFLGAVRVGQEVLVKSSAFPDRIFRGTIDWISPTIDPDRGFFQVRATLERVEPDLLPDLAVSAEIITGRIPESMIIEQGYTFRENDTVYLFIERDGSAVKRAITVSDLGRGLYLVQEGLTPGERVLTALDLEDGQSIRLSE